MPRPKAELILTDDERQALRTWASRPKSTLRLATRARIVLACAEGLDNKAVAARLRVGSATVGTWRRRFVERRLDGLSDEMDLIKKLGVPADSVFLMDGAGSDGLAHHGRFEHRDCVHVPVGSRVPRRNQAEQRHFLEHAQLHHDPYGRVRLRSPERRLGF